MKARKQMRTIDTGESATNIKRVEKKHTLALDPVSNRMSTTTHDLSKITEPKSSITIGARKTSTTFQAYKPNMTSRTAMGNYGAKADVATSQDSSQTRRKSILSKYSGVNNKSNLPIVESKGSITQPQAFATRYASQGLITEDIRIQGSKQKL